MESNQKAFLPHKGIGSFINVLKWSFLIVLFFTCYYFVSPKYEFKNTNLRKNRITGKIEIVSDNFEWVDLLAEDKKFEEEEKQKKKIKDQILMEDASKIFVDYDPDLSPPKQ